MLIMSISGKNIIEITRSKVKEFYLNHKNNCDIWSDCCTNKSRNECNDDHYSIDINASAISHFLLFHFLSLYFLSTGFRARAGYHDKLLDLLLTSSHPILQHTLQVMYISNIHQCQLHELQSYFRPLLLRTYIRF